MTEDDYQAHLARIWAQLESRIGQVAVDPYKKLSANEFTQSYMMVYNFCTQQSKAPPENMGFIFGGDLYARLRAWLLSHVAAVAKDQDRLSGRSALEFYCHQWGRFTHLSKTIDHCFDYLNRYWIARQISASRDAQFIYELALSIWYEKLTQACSSSLLPAVFELIGRMRLSASHLDEEAALVEGFVSSISHLQSKLAKQGDLFVTYFQSPFLESTLRFYEAEGDQWIQSLSISDFIGKVHQIIQKENSMLESLLAPLDAAKLNEALNRALIGRHKETIQASFTTFVASDPFQDAGICYSLLSRLPKGLEDCRKLFEEFVHASGRDALAPLLAPAEGSAADSAKAFVGAVFKVHQHASAICARSFASDSAFVSAMDKACRIFVNQMPKCAEVLARYCDSVLKREARDMSEAELESFLVEALLVFKYLEEKDVFQSFYTKCLAKRLVMNLSVSADAESALIARLKQLCGLDYTSKLQRMFTDITTSKGVNEAFVKAGESSGPFDFHTLVLCTGSWPLNPSSVALLLPPEVQARLDSFDSFYKQQHSGRALHWLHSLSRGEIKATFTVDGVEHHYLFTVSAYQMAILTAFNDASALAVEALMQRTGLALDVLSGALVPLIQATILLCPDDLLAPTSTLVLNERFSSKKVRVNLNIPPKLEAKREAEETLKTIEEDRKMAIQAAVVRIMKGQQQMKHVALVSAVISELGTRFKLQVLDIKKSIDVLVEKDYIERMPGSTDMLRYIA